MSRILIYIILIVVTIMSKCFRDATLLCHSLQFAFAQVQAGQRLLFALGALRHTHAKVDRTRVERVVTRRGAVQVALRRAALYGTFHHHHHVVAQVHSHFFFFNISGLLLLFLFFFVVDVFVVVVGSSSLSSSGCSPRGHLPAQQTKETLFLWRLLTRQLPFLFFAASEV